MKLRGFSKARARELVVQGVSDGRVRGKDDAFLAPRYPMHSPPFEVWWEGVVRGVDTPSWSADRIAREAVR